jgi:hypothetical protein
MIAPMSERRFRRLWNTVDPASTAVAETWRTVAALVRLRRLMRAGVRPPGSRS